MNAIIDLNSDLGEGAGHDEEILELVTSANIACGLHAGNPESIRATIRLAQEKGVAVGAHPSLNDRENFGRLEKNIPAAEVRAIVTLQLENFQALCGEAGMEINHVKPHGALYNMAARDLELATAIVDAIIAIDDRLMLFVPPLSCLEAASMKLGLDSMTEFFADRNYMSDGSLVPRSHQEALLRDPVAAADRLLQVLHTGMVRAIDGTDISAPINTVCVHGDTPEAVSFVRELRRRLDLEDVTIAAPGKRA